MGQGRIEHTGTSGSKSVCNHYAGNTKFAQKALSLQEELHGAFEITLDLEDGAPRGQKLRLAEDFIEILESNRNIFKKTGVRLPGFPDPEFRSLAGLFLGEKHISVHHITIPKLQSAAEFNRVKASLSGVLAKGNTTLPPLRVLVEHHGILPEIGTIAKDPAVETLELGIMDFISSMNGVIPMSECDALNEFDNPLIQYLKSRLSTEAARNKKTAVHNVCREYKNDSLIEQFCIKAKKSGFGKMWSIHPAQISLIINIFTPTDEELEEAANILHLAESHDWGPISFNNTLHDMASYRYYYFLLKRAMDLGITAPVNPEDFEISIQN